MHNFILQIIPSKPFVMRLLLILLVCLPVFGFAQKNRSAATFARETIENYITTKIFKNQPYQVVEFSGLESFRIGHLETVWVMEHRFQILEKGKEDTVTWHPYHYVFYFDKKMKIRQTKSTW